MSKTYIVEKDIKEWLEEHKSTIFDDILISCEDGLQEESDRVLVATIRTMHGVTLFNLPTVDAIIGSLRKCEIYYVETEEYEKAGRALKCSDMWADPQRYIKKTSV